MKNKWVNEINKIFYQANLEPNDIKKIIHIKKSYTNEIFKVILKKNIILKVRLSNKNVDLNRKLEKEIEYSMYDEDIIFFSENGDYIKNWIPGRNVKLFDGYRKKFWKEIKNEIDDFRKKTEGINVEFKKETFLIPNDLEYKLDNLQKEMYCIYLKYMNDMFKNNKMVITHTDISMNNILKTKDNKYKIIDFEWVALSIFDWDICNLIKDFNFKLKRIKKMNILDDVYNKIWVLFCVHFYTFIWTIKMNENNKIKRYQKKILKQTIYWYKKITH